MHIWPPPSLLFSFLRSNYYCPLHTSYVIRNGKIGWQRSSSHTPGTRVTMIGHEKVFKKIGFNICGVVIFSAHCVWIYCNKLKSIVREGVGHKLEFFCLVSRGDVVMVTAFSLDSFLLHIARCPFHALSTLLDLLESTNTMLYAERSFITRREPQFPIFLVPLRSLHSHGRIERNVVFFTHCYKRREINRWGVKSEWK